MNTAKQDQPSLLIVDDDIVFCEVLQTAMEKRGFDVSIAHSVASAIDLIGDNSPEYAIVDLSMPGESGLTLVKKFKAMDEQTRIVVLTGYASITTAIEAIKLGAIHYLAKPADADEIVAAFYRDAGDSQIPVTAQTQSVARLQWEHIQKVLHECNGNISETARRLNMHRRTLQRKLAKHPVKQ